MATQLEGTIKLGADSGSAVDCSAEVFAFTITETRNTSTRRATFANARESEKAGSSTDTVTIDFEDNLDPSTSLAHKEIADALRTDTGELYFEVLFKTGAVSATNPQYSGKCVVTEVTTGGEVGEELEQSQTFTVTEDGITITTI